VVRPVRLDDAEQVQKILPQWEIVKHLGAVVRWPYRSDGAPHLEPLIPMAALPCCHGSKKLLGVVLKSGLPLLLSPTM
jgi:hypothetical protein